MIIIPTEIGKIETLRDRTIKVSLYTQELPPEKAGQLLLLSNQLCYVAFKRETFANEEKQILETMKAAEKVGKTKAQRLRAVLHVYWKHNPQGFETSDQFYDFWMERKIEEIKTTLP